MSFNLEKFYDAIDGQFEGKKESEKIILYTLPFIVLGFLSYKFLFPISERFIAPKKQEHTALIAKIKESKEYLKTKEQLVATIAQAQANNKALSIKLQNMRAENTAVANELLKLNFINMNDENLLDFAHYVTSAASESRVKIVSMSTKLNNKKFGVFQKEFTTELNASGNFKSTLSFINAIENSKMFLRIKQLAIRGAGELNSSMVIEVYGL